MGCLEGYPGVETSMENWAVKVETSPSLAGSRLLAEGPPAASPLQGCGALVRQEDFCGINCWISTDTTCRCREITRNVDRAEV